MFRLFAFVLLLLSVTSFGQSPGQIVRPAGGNGITILNPNGDGYTSATTAGYTTNDVAQSEIAFKLVPVAITEPTGDVATGPSGGFTDIVKTIDNSDFYVYSDGTNLLFRLRIGNVISGSKGYSVLIDTDGKMGNSGPSADPNYVAPTNTANGNPGFEYEAVLQTNFQVAVYNIDGSTSPGAPVATYALNTHSQISMALTTDGNNPDYFYDWYIPLSAIGSPTFFRLAATTVTSPNSALQGVRSDIYGIDDALGGNAATAWTTVINSQPSITVASIGSGGTGPGATCTAPPVLNAPINTGSNINVTGTWTRLDVSKPSTATITLYKNGVAAGTTTATTGNAWNIAVATIAPGDAFYAMAVSGGGSSCLQSNSITAGCAAIPVSATITCASTKGITGTIPLGTTVNIYQVTTAQANPATTPLTTGLVYTNNASDRTFNYYGTNPQSGNACQGQNNLLPNPSTYMIVTNNNGCLSAPTFMCITGSSQNSWNLIGSNLLSIPSIIYPFHTSISGTGATTGQLLRLFINNQYVSSITAAASTFSFTGLTLKAGDVLRIYAQASGACMTQSAAFTVSCFLTPPVITTNTLGQLLNSSASISGTLAVAGATIQLYRGIAPLGTLAGTTAANSNGTWSVGSLVLSAGETYYATQTSGGCTSAASVAAAVLAPTLICPQFASSTYAEGSASVGGGITAFTGTVRLYIDGVLAGSVALTNASSWSIPVNTNYSNTLYAGAILIVTAQSATGAENTTCTGFATITCTSPSTPNVTPLISVINPGQSVSFTVSNVNSSTWYSVRDNSGISYATATYATASTNLNITTATFNTPGSYVLNITADKLSGCSVSFLPAAVTVLNLILPVTFVSVSAREEHGSAMVQWVVANEQDVNHYLVERSADCSHFETAGKVAFKATGPGNNTYQFTDNTPPAAEQYCYRIRQVDKNGQFLYSPVVYIQQMINTFSWNILPNPAPGKAIISIQSPLDTRGFISLVNAQGQLLFRQSVNLPKGTSTVAPAILEKLSPGIYIIQLEANGQKSSRKWIRE